MANATPRPLYPRERPGTHCIGGCVGPRACLDGCGKSRPHTPGFDPRTVQPVTSRCTHWAIPVHEVASIVLENLYTLLGEYIAMESRRKRRGLFSGTTDWFGWKFTWNNTGDKSGIRNQYLQVPISSVFHLIDEDSSAIWDVSPARYVMLQNRHGSLANSNQCKAKTDLQKTTQKYRTSHLKLYKRKLNY